MFCNNSANIVTGERPDSSIVGKLAVFIQQLAEAQLDPLPGVGGYGKFHCSRGCVCGFFAAWRGLWGLGAPCLKLGQRGERGRVLRFF